MKALLVTFALGFSSLTFACTNFSGTYRFPGEVGQFQDNQIVQSACNSLSLVAPDVTLSIVADGQYHQTLDEDVIIDGQNVGKLTLSHRAHFGEVELFLDTKAQISMMGQVNVQETKTVNTLNEAGDLVSVMTFEDGHQEIIIAQRIK